jgi:hypothetical protein
VLFSQSIVFLAGLCSERMLRISDVPDPLQQHAMAQLDMEYTDITVRLAEAEMGGRQEAVITSEDDSEQRH